jgi:hypothetical protein
MSPKGWQQEGAIALLGKVCSPLSGPKQTPKRDNLPQQPTQKNFFQAIVPWRKVKADRN